MSKRAPDHDLKVGGHGSGSGGGQCGLADPADAEQGDQAAAVMEQPLLQLRHFGLAAVERADLGRLAPILTGRGRDRERG